MSRTTLANAKTELVGLLSASGVSTVTGVDAVYDHLPPASVLAGPVSAAVFTAGMNANFWLIGVRLFVDAQGDTKEMQDNLDLLMPRIDAAANNGGFGPSDWDITFPGEGELHLVATAVYQVGRQDF